MEMEADGLLVTDTLDDYKGFHVAVNKGDRISRLQSKEAVWETWSGGQPMPQAWVTVGEKGSHHHSKSKVVQTHGSDK